MFGENYSNVIEYVALVKKPLHERLQNSTHNTE